MLEISTNKSLQKDVGPISQAHSNYQQAAQPRIFCSEHEGTEKRRWTLIVIEPYIPHAIVFAVILD